MSNSRAKELNCLTLPDGTERPSRTITSYQRKPSSISEKRRGVGNLLQ